MNNSPQMRMTMKSTLTLFAIAAALGLQAQNVNVVNAFNYTQSGELAKAAEYIEPATEHAKTGMDEKTWRYRGEIYRLIAMGKDEELKQQFPNAMELAIESYLKANELDEKGRYARENRVNLGVLQVTSLNAGNDAFTAKELDKAIALYGHAERIAAAYGEVDTNAVFNAALAHDTKGDAEMAMKRYRECLELGYDKAEVYRYLASTQRRNDDLTGAIETTYAGLEKHPDDNDLILDVMSFLLEADRSEEAESMVELAIEKNPDNAVLYSVLGSLYDKKASVAVEAGDEAGMYDWYDKAEQAYKSSIEKDETFFDAYFNIGVLYNNRAAYEYEECNKIKSDKEYMKCKDLADEVYLKAKPYFEQAHEQRPDDVATIQQLMKLYAKTNDQESYAKMKAKLGS